MGKPINRVGKKFNRLTVIKKDLNKKSKRTYWICKCDCGTIKSIESGHLVGGTSKSCGCLQIETIAKNRPAPKHRMTKTPEFKTWDGMKQRCNNPNSKDYPNWGGRGIKIHPSWLGENGFIAFYKDMGPRPTDLHSMNRIDNNGNYEPSNCMWATHEEQMRNRGVSKIKDMDQANEIRKLYKTGEYLQRELAEKYGVVRQTISDIVNNKRWIE